MFLVSLTNAVICAIIVYGLRLTFIRSVALWETRMRSLFWIILTVSMLTVSSAHAAWTRTTLRAGGPVVLIVSGEHYYMQGNPGEEVIREGSPPSPAPCAQPAPTCQPAPPCAPAPCAKVVVTKVVVVDRRPARVVVRRTCGPTLAVRLGVGHHHDHHRHKKCR